MGDTSQPALDIDETIDGFDRRKVFKPAGPILGRRDFGQVVNPTNRWLQSDSDDTRFWALE